MSKYTVQNDHSKSFISWRTTSSQDLDWTLVFVSFLSRYPSDTITRLLDQWNQNLKPHLIGSDFMYCFIPDLSLNFTIVLQCFAHYHSIASQKISNLGGLSLGWSWKLCLFYHPFCYLQNVDFEGSHNSKNCLILFREQNRKKPLHLLTFHQLQLSQEELLHKQFLYDFWFIFHGRISKVSSMQENNSFKDGLFSWKIIISTLRDINVSTNWMQYKSI